MGTVPGMRFGSLCGILIVAACSPVDKNERGGGGGGGGGGDGGGGGGGGGSIPADAAATERDAAVDAPGNLSAHAYCVERTNYYRTNVPPPGSGSARSPVAESTQLEAYADTGAMVDDGTSPHNHFIMTDGGGIAFAENECPNWDLSYTNGDLNMLVAACVTAFYDEGPGGGHYENMMGPYATLGCGIYQSGSDVTIVQDYGY